MYVDFEYYTNSFAGTTVPAEEFATIERDAERYLSYVTQEQYLDVTEEKVIVKIKNALCAAVEAVNAYSQEYSNIPSGITSETTDGHSVTFAKVDPSKMVQQKRCLMYDIFAQELFSTGLLYQGAG